MRKIVLAGLALFVAAGTLSAAPAGATESDQTRASLGWPVAADLISSNLVVHQVGDDLWILDYDTARDTEGEVNDLAARCRAAGLTADQCRRIIHDHHRDLAERCRAAGLTAEQCRRLVNDHTDNGPSIADRCRAAGLTTEECRRIINSLDGGTLAQRCRAAGLTTEECRRIINAHDDTGDRATDVRPDGTRVDRVGEAQRPQRVPTRTVDRAADRVADRA